MKFAKCCKHEVKWGKHNFLKTNYCTISFNLDVMRHRPLWFVQNVTFVLGHTAHVQNHLASQKIGVFCTYYTISVFSVSIHVTQCMNCNDISRKLWNLRPSERVWQKLSMKTGMSQRFSTKSPHLMPHCHHASKSPYNAYLPPYDASHTQGY